MTPQSQFVLLLHGSLEIFPMTSSTSREWQWREQNWNLTLPPIDSKLFSLSLYFTASEHVSSLSLKHAIKINCNWLTRDFNLVMPWNMFITAKSYFVNYKLSETYTNQTSEYAGNFLQYLGFASQIPNVIFNWMNIFVNLGWVSIKKDQKLNFNDFSIASIVVILQNVLSGV